MKNGHLKRKFNSTLSCIAKCLRFFSNMIHKKIFFGLFLVGLLGACTAPTAMLGPAYTLGSSGNVLQAGLNYGSNQMITKYTGKTPIENLKEIKNLSKKQTKNIKKETLESEEFYILVKNKIDKTSGILKLPIQ